MSELHYYINYAETRDIDCFFRVKNVAYHFASNGQPIPSFITRKTNMAVQNVVYELLENARGDVHTKDKTIHDLILKEFESIEGQRWIIDERDGLGRMIHDYAESFRGMARLGFISMDLDENGVYHVIAEPTEQTVSDKLMQLLPEIEDGLLRIE